MMWAPLLAMLALVSAKNVDITISKAKTVSIPNTFYGYMWEVCEQCVICAA